MINENEFDYVDMSDEELELELARQAVNEAIEHAKTTLQMSENCYRRFGEQLLTETRIDGLPFQIQNDAAAIEQASV